MKYTLTTHARDVLEAREIPVAWLERILNQPQQVEPDPDDTDLQHHLGRIAEHGNRVLRVVVNKTVRPARVVTVYFDRTMRNKL
ncbi:MAG: DUF4258 domain-containing protein [Verrucomicrobiota bacterium]